jgi:two-component system, sensor histidine kinase RegB
MKCDIMSHPPEYAREHGPGRYNRRMLFPSLFKVLPQHETLWRLIWMRAIALTCQLTGVVAATLWLEVHFAVAPVLTVMLLLAAFNGWTWWRMQQPQPVGDLALFLQLFIDVAALSALLYLSGGATNPFVSFYLPALAVGASILPWRFALALAAFSLASYSVMMSTYVPLHVMNHDMAVNYHLIGMWANFALSAGLITWFVARMSRALRVRDAQLALAREQHLQNERMIALGTQAASAAHELGTPLSTIAVIAGDLKHEIAQNASLAMYGEDIATIETQIALCKASLDRMGTTAGAVPPVAPVTATAWLKQFIETWRLRCPATRLTLSFSASDAQIANAQDLGQILLTLLDNAAYAAYAAGGTNTPVSLSLRFEHRSAIVQIKDRGPGISPALLKRLGYEQVDSSSGGQGLGLMLAFATARQVGARIALSSRQGEGTTATVTAPIHEA